jgi:hypothetical protein
MELSQDRVQWRALILAVLTSGYDTILNVTWGSHEY